MLLGLRLGHGVMQTLCCNCVCLISSVCTAYRLRIRSKEKEKKRKQCAELAAIAAALTHKYTHIRIATDSLSSLQQLRKQILYPEEHKHSVQRDRSAKYQASLEGDILSDTGIPSTGSGGNPFYNNAWPRMGRIKTEYT
eukprot:1156657-Pelagomonas_calceolata.AAC.5